MRLHTVFIYIINFLPCFVHAIVSQTIQCATIAQLHRSLKEFIKVLIAVTSRLDAVVACINALNPKENR